MLIYNILGAYQPSHEIMLRFYSYYKQATEGPCQQTKPAFWEVVKKAKWDAWTRLGNMSRLEAMNNYVEELTRVNMHFESDLMKLMQDEEYIKQEHYIADCRNYVLHG